MVEYIMITRIYLVNLEMWPPFNYLTYLRYTRTDQLHMFKRVQVFYKFKKAGDKRSIETLHVYEKLQLQ
jgi:hypothetical protein